MLYTITIAPADDSGATTTVVVDTADDASRITDVHLHSAKGLTNGRLPEIDFDLLLAAFTPAASAASAASAVSSRVGGVPAEIDAAPFEVAAATDAAEGEAPTSPDAVVPTEPVASAPTTGRSRRRTARSRPGSTAAAPATPRRRNRATATSSSDPGTGDVPAEIRAGRQYRRMPADLGEVYRTAGSVRAVAEHYAVPRHTAQGWIGRLNRSAQA